MIDCPGNAKRCFSKNTRLKLRLPAREGTEEKVNSQEGQVLISVFLFLIVYKILQEIIVYK